jgi:3D (Asp-Asp-Asp) domain-containing protein
MKKYYGIGLFMGFTITFVLLFSYLTPEPKPPTQGIPHNYWVPTNQEDTIDIIDSTEIQIDDDNIDMNCGDTLDVRATMYHPIIAQCDSTPLITADGSIIDPYCVSNWNWIAVSRDLLVSSGGCLNYGDSVYVIAGHKTGWYHIHDTMNKRKRNQIDFLESIGTHVYRYTKAELVINS